MTDTDLQLLREALTGALTYHTQPTRADALAALGRVGERIRELERLVAKSAENADVRADADSVPGYKDRVFALAAEIAVLVCVRDVAHVDDRPGRKRLDQAANEIGYLLGLPQLEFAELWAARIDRPLVDRAEEETLAGS